MNTSWSKTSWSKTGDLFDDKKVIQSDKQVINRLNLITDKQSKTIVELENKILELVKQKEQLEEQTIILKKKIFDIEIENRILSERIIELDSIISTPASSKVDLEDTIEKKKLKIIQQRMQKKAILYGSLKTARREIIEKGTASELLKTIQT